MTHHKKEVIISLCHKKKYGLLDLSKALILYGNRYEKELFFYSISSLLELVNFLKFNKNKIVCCVIWDNSIFSLLASIFIKLKKIKIIYYFHEPGGLKHKIDNLNVSYKLAILQFTSEIFFKFISDFTAVSLKKNIKYGNFFLPILYSDLRPSRKRNLKKIGFIGFKKKERCPKLFEDVIYYLRPKGYDAAYFPSDQYGFSETDKFNFLSKVDIVWNVFCCPNNLSAVTGDAFMSKTPLIISKYERFGALLKKHNLCIKINISNTPEQIANKILFYLQNNNKSLINIKEDQAKFGGSSAYIKYWHPTFNFLKNK